MSGLWQELRGHVHLGVVEIDGWIVCTALFSESNGIVDHLSGTEEHALKLSPMKILINHARQWATQRGATVLHLGGAQDSLMHFKAGFFDRRHLFKTWRVVLDEQRYPELSGKELGSTGFFPAYRGEYPHEP